VRAALSTYDSRGRLAEVGVPLVPVGGPVRLPTADDVRDHILSEQSAGCAPVGLRPGSACGIVEPDRRARVPSALRSELMT